MAPPGFCPVPRRGVVKDQDYRDQSYYNVTAKNLTVRWTPGHRDLRNATTYQDYVDIRGNNDSDTLANIGDNLPMDPPPPGRHGMHTSHPLTQQFQTIYSRCRMPDFLQGRSGTVQGAICRQDGVRQDSTTLHHGVRRGFGLSTTREGIVLDNQGVVKATPVPRRGVVKDQDYRDQSYYNVTAKNLTVRWTPGHRDLRNATTYQDYVDIRGNNDSDTLANIGDNLPMDPPPPGRHGMHTSHPLTQQFQTIYSRCRMPDFLQGRSGTVQGAICRQDGVRQDSTTLHHGVRRGFGLSTTREGIVLDNQGVVKATPVPRRGVVKDQDYRDQGYYNVTAKNLTVRWTPGHGDLRNATRYQDYVDVRGNDDPDTLANMGDNLPMDLPPPQAHDIVLHGHIMPTPAKSWIMQLRQQKQTANIH